MNKKSALIKNLSDVYSPSKYLNSQKYPFNICKCQYSSFNYKYDNFCNYKNLGVKNFNFTAGKVYDLSNDYDKPRNTDIINNNNLKYSNEKRKNKKVEYSKSMDKVLKPPHEYQINYTYDNKSLLQINKEIIKFKNKMNKDKEYLKYIHNKILTNSNINRENQKSFNDCTSRDYTKLRKRAYSLSNRTSYKDYANINKNINFEFNDFYSEKRKIKNSIITNNLINHTLDDKKINQLNNYKENSITRSNQNDLCDSKVNNICSPKRNNSFLYMINKNLNKFDKNKINNINNKYKNKNSLNDNEIVKTKNINEYEYIKYPEKSIEDFKQNKYSNKKYLTISSKNDKIQLKEKEIKINDISNLNNNYLNNYYPENNNINSMNKNIKELLKYKIKKYDSFVDDIINEKNKENIINNNKNNIFSLTNNINLLTNYEIIKKKYDTNNNNSENNLSKYSNTNNNINKNDIYNFKNNDEKKEQELLINNINYVSTLNNINTKYTEDIKLTNIKKKYLDTITLADKDYINNNYYTIKNNNNINNKNINNNNNNINNITSFSINIKKEDDNNKDLIIKNLNEKIKEFEEQLKIANSKIKELSKIIEDIKNKNKNNLLYIDKITSFNYITIQNHFIKLNKTNFNINNNNIKNKRQKANNKNEIIIHFPDRAILGRSANSSKYINTTSENEHHSYTSFDNYKNMNIYFRKITTTVNDQKIYKNKQHSLNKNHKRYNQKLSLFKLNHKKESSKDNINISGNSSINDIKINEKIIYTLYPSKENVNILIFDPNTKKFSSKKMTNNDNFVENYQKDKDFSRNLDDKFCKGNVFLYNEGYLYIVTGKDYNLFYKYDPYKKQIISLSKLKYNHSNGNLIYYDQRIFCISGDFNKKVECYIESKNEWIDIPEMITSRSNFSTCIIKEQYLFVLFGYNKSNKQYLNSIEFIDLLYENAKWKYLYYDNCKNISLFLAGSLSINYDDKKIIIFGGYNGINKKQNTHIYLINLKKNFDDEENYDINDENLSKIDCIKQGLENNNENKCYIFDKGYNKYYDNNNIIYTFFDSEFHAHTFNINTLTHEIYDID